MHTNWRRGILTLAFGIGLVSSILRGQCADLAPAPDRDDPVRQVLMRLQDAITSRNAASTLSLFADDIRFLDQTGEETVGRDGMKSRLEHLFKTNLVTEVGIHPQSITFPVADVALVTGEVSRKQDQARLPVSRFTMAMTKQQNTWLVNAMTETAISPAAVPSRLPELEWLLGEWTVESSQGTASLKAEWATGRNFISAKTEISKKGSPTQVDTQMIGWDPQRKIIISWHFDSNGGYGSGLWSKLPDGNGWQVDVTGVGADSSNTTASNVFTVRSPDEFTWQSVNRSLNGTPVGDTEPITLRKVK